MTLGSCCINNEDCFLPMFPKEVQIKGLQQRLLLNLEVTQIFQNTNENPSEISYIFPNDLKICIYEITFVINDIIIKPKLIGRKEANLIYKEAISSGKTAVYGSNIADGLTEIKLGNLPINSECRVIIKMAFKANLVNLNTFFFKIPLDVYNPDGSVNCLDITSNFSMNIQSDKEIVKLIKSNVLNGFFDPKEKTFSISKEIQNNFNEHSIILYFLTQKKLTSSLILSNDGNYCTASIVNDFEFSNQRSRNEFIFLVDCSGSMKGSSNINAGKCLEIFIKSLPENSFFNIFYFGSIFKQLFSQSVEYNKQTANKGISFAKSIDANLGGTCIYDPLLSIFETKPISKKRNIFILTDGEVINREDVIELVKRNSNANKCFTIGLGRGCDAGLLEAIAEVSNGKCNFVQEGDLLSEKVIPQLQVSLHGSIDKIGIFSEGENNDSLEITPFPVPSINYNDAIQVFIHNKKNSFLNGILVVGQNESEPVDIQINDIIDAESVEEDKFGCSNGMNIEKSIKPLFAFEMLKNYERKVVISKEEEELAIQLSITSGVLCKYTGYVGMIEPSEKAMKKFNSIRSQSSLSACKLQKNECVLIDGKRYNVASVSNAKTGKHGHGKTSIALIDPKSGETIHKMVPSTEKLAIINDINDHGNFINMNSINQNYSNFDLTSLISYQSFEGYWKNHQEVNKLAGIDVNHIDKLKIDNEQMEDRCIATIVAIAALHVLASDNANSWQLIEKKGISWLNKALTNKNIDELIFEIEQLIQNQSKNKKQ